MVVINSDILLYQCTNNPADDTSTLGGAISATQITGGSLGEVFNKKASNASGGADKITYGKVFFKNNNGSDTLFSPKFYILNGLLAPVADGVFTVNSTSALDTWTTYKKYLKVSYKNSAGTNTYEYIRLNGLTSVNGTGTAEAGELVNIELKTATGTSEAESDSQTTSSGDITIARGINLGIIPTGYKTATGCYQIGVEATLDDTETTTNRLTAPTGITFSLPNTESGALDAVADMTTTTAQGIWVEQTLSDGMLSVADMQVILRCFGEDV